MLERIEQINILVENGNFLKSIDGTIKTVRAKAEWSARVSKDGSR